MTGFLHNFCFLPSQEKGYSFSQITYSQFLWRFANLLAISCKILTESVPSLRHSFKLNYLTGTVFVANWFTFHQELAVWERGLNSLRDGCRPSRLSHSQYESLLNANKLSPTSRFNHSRWISLKKVALRRLKSVSPGTARNKLSTESQLFRSAFFLLRKCSFTRAHWTRLHSFWTIST